MIEVAFPSTQESLLILDNRMYDGPALLICAAYLAPLRKFIHPLHHLIVDLDFAPWLGRPRRW